MNRENLFQLIQLKEELIPLGRLNRPGVDLKVSNITIYFSSNKNARADAKMHSRFLKQRGNYNIREPQSGEETKHWISWHFTVDDKLAIKHLPIKEMSYHTGSSDNNNSISIVICNYEGINQNQAIEKAAQLVSLLCFDHSIPLAKVIPHNFWIKENSPVLLITSWKAFFEKSVFYYKEITYSATLETKTQTDNINSQISEIQVISPQLFEQPFHIDITNANKPVFVEEGFNKSFLKSGKVSLPTLKNNGDHLFIHHQNMSIYFNKDRKLALYTSCNYDKEALFEPMKRSNYFRDDPLLDINLQLGKGFYSSDTLEISPGQKYFDRGHLIARRYNQWGFTEEEARQGERDTYFHTTIHPQVKELNQDEWEKLESFIIESGKLDVNRVSIIAGALLLPNDPVATYEDAFYKEKRTIKIPIVYWKVVYYEVNNELRRIGFLMSQRNRLKEIHFVKFEDRAMVAKDPFDQIGDPLKTYIIRCDLIESATGLTFNDAVELYNKEEPLEVVIEDNETHSANLFMMPSNLSKYI